MDPPPSSSSSSSSSSSFYYHYYLFSVCHRYSRGAHEHNKHCEYFSSRALGSNVTYIRRGRHGREGGKEEGGGGRAYLVDEGSTIRDHLLLDDW